MKAVQITLKRQENCRNFIQKQYMKIFPGLVAAIILFSACSSGGDKQSGTDSSAITTTDSVVTFTPVDTSSEFIQTFSSNLQPWLERTAQTPDLKLDQFRYKETLLDDSLVITQANLTPDFYKTYKQVLIFSPDSSKVLDLGSYGAVLEKNANGKTNIIQGEPDSEIAVLDRATRQRRRLFFFGPGSSIEQGFWINDTSVVLAGKTEDKGKVMPVIWTVRLEKDDNIITRYEPKDQ
jgi:hypothetical protein